MHQQACKLSGIGIRGNDSSIPSVYLRGGAVSHRPVLMGTPLVRMWSRLASGVSSAPRILGCAWEAVGLLTSGSRAPNIMLGSYSCMHERRISRSGLAAFTAPHMSHAFPGRGGFDLL